MTNLFETGGLLSKKNLSAWLSLLLLFNLPFLCEAYLLLRYWPQWWAGYLIVMVFSMLLGAILSGRLLYKRLNRARKCYDHRALARLLGTYLLPLALLSPGLLSFMAGLVLLIPPVTSIFGELLIRLLAITPQQLYSSILLVHTREMVSKKRQIVQ